MRRASCRVPALHVRPFPDARRLTRAARCEPRGTARDRQRERGAGRATAYAGAKAVGAGPGRCRRVVSDRRPAADRADDTPEHELRRRPSRIARLALGMAAGDAVARRGRASPSLDLGRLERHEHRAPTSDRPRGDGRRARLDLRLGALPRASRSTTGSSSGCSRRSGAAPCSRPHGGPRCRSRSAATGGPGTRSASRRTGVDRHRGDQPEWARWTRCSGAPTRSSVTTRGSAVSSSSWPTRSGTGAPSRSAIAIVRADYPLDTREVLAALSAGRAPALNGVALMRLRRGHPHASTPVGTWWTARPAKGRNWWKTRLEATFIEP